MSNMSINKIKGKELKTLFHKHKVIKIYFSSCYNQLNRKKETEKNIIHGKKKRERGKKSEIRGVERQKKRRKTIGLRL